ncbi:WD40 repeat domain-containing protein [Paenibacillus popilliae]|uniref:Uncharacterized protein n=1 Tax=Paenibacillus popilliae TaxID=78057 RepID=A0ABY3B1M9_PAEPP|nr:WD40 repeat domain-containing protein [Paenibacillus sp. SDF0028]TQR46761.1 hypothetical protein C7Y44_03650 [Paenibacillus sp. SDF0028]
MSASGIKTEPVEQPTSICVEDQGNKEELNFTILPSSRKSYAYENARNSIRTYFKEDICESSPIIVEGNNFELEWSPIGAGFQDEHGNITKLGTISSSDALKIESNKIVYPEVFPDIDEEFIIYEGQVKHNTILHSLPQAPLSENQLAFFTEGKIDVTAPFSMFINDQLQEDQQFVTSERIVFRNNSGELMFQLPAPVTYEVKTKKNIICKYEVSRINNVLYIKTIVPYAWLAHPDRRYPIAIDPTVEAVVSDNEATLNNAWYTSFANRSNMFAIGKRTTANIFQINETTNKAEELPQPTSGYSIDRCSSVLFSNDDSYFFLCGYKTIKVYKFDPVSRGYTTEIVQKNFSTPQEYIYAMSLDPSGNRIAFGAGYSIYVCNFDSQTGQLTNLMTKGVPYQINKIQFFGDTICYQSGVYLYICKYIDGRIDKELEVPPELKNKNITSFDLSSDGKYIAVGISGNAKLSVYDFDVNKGIIGSPEITTHTDNTINAVSFSKKQKYIATFQYEAWKKEPRLVFYRFDSRTKKLGARLTIDSAIRQPNPNLNNECKSMQFSYTGRYFSAISWNESTFVYKFFYEPENNIFFKDEVTEDYYSDDSGQVLKLVDLETIIAGQTTMPKKILLENAFKFDVNNIQLFIDNPSQEYQVELSKTETPFVPENRLLIPITLTPSETCSFFLRVTSSEKTKSGGMFDIRVKCDKV